VEHFGATDAYKGLETSLRDQDQGRSNCRFVPESAEQHHPRLRAAITANTRVIVVSQLRM